MNKHDKGFTLIELIIYVGLFAIFMTGCVIFAWDAILSAEKSNVQNEISENLRLATQRISFEIRNSSGINSLSSSNLSLSNTDTARDPTVFDITNGRLRIGFGSSGSCPATSPCYLTDNKVVVTSLSFENLSVAGLSKNIKFTISLGVNNSYSGAAEIRSR